ncbi:SPOR domain-containing protein [Moritella sp.]|uniref:SPOR domain-containing protein n=1 Tax=Moritella sp. TaxID=78556 RepID=UPI001E0E0477|nr:SPOR domain-containing protein [Moritella sp.]MCJ8349673.1 SPOR domain-containing protein [Moritella sp.]NQZ39848.1 SPOR domain-containing protein [Moritella sp.]
MHYSVQTEIYSQMQLCERLRHLTQFSSHLLLVSGESGSGKSTVLRNYVESDFNQKTITIDALQCHDDVALRTLLLQQISYDGRFNAHASLIDSLPLFAQQLEHELTICIDNAMALSAASITEFAQLVELCLNNRISIKINIILFAESQWVDLTMLEFAKSATNVLELEMTALDPQAAVQFVEQQFNQADYKPTFVNQDAINRQIEACKGNPAELAKCAQAIMLGQVYKPESAITNTATQSTKNKSFYLAGIIAGLLLLGSAGSFLYDAYQTEQPQATDIIVAESLQHPSEMMHGDTVSSDTGSDVSSTQMLASDWDEELPTEIGQTITLTAPILAESGLQTQKQRVVIDDDAVNKMLAKQSSADASPVIDSKTDLQVVENTSNTVTGKAWVMAQPAKNYTFQIAGLSREIQLKQYLSENELPENIWTYQTQRNNKPWYVVLYGSFSSVQQANAAKQKLPARVQKDKPWLKRFIQIQRDL